MARIALDIDSTLHHYWDLFADLAHERFGVALPYDEQRDWGITTLTSEQVSELVEETHSDENVLSADPYPEAVATVKAWHEEGHWIHVTSHRTPKADAVTREWLDQIGMPYDDLHCSYDKISRCVELGIDVLIDDSPVNLARARDAGIVAATIVHPWNRELAAREDVIGAADWPELRVLLAPILRD